MPSTCQKSQRNTLFVEVDLGFYVKKEEKVRLARINAPELTADALAGSHPTSCGLAGGA
ncbi:MAG: hypothetical protein RIF36_21830 [Imperialibacter sp.]|uniref:hypothetical protein n=1 Tax=Imperialibacter sp. TaxID=2038411 RepID=UPI0032F00A1F